MLFRINHARAEMPAPKTRKKRAEGKAAKLRSRSGRVVAMRQAALKNHINAVPIQAGKKHL
jgi:hypothetical protein